MPRKKKGSKGLLIWDEGANSKLIRAALDAGFQVKTINPQDKGQKDSYIIEKYTRGRYPLCTIDYVIEKNWDLVVKAPAYILFESVQSDEFFEYKKVFIDFLKQHTTKSLSGYIWKVTLKSGVLKQKLNVR